MKSIGIGSVMPTLNRSFCHAIFPPHMLISFFVSRVAFFHRSYASWPGQAVAYKVGQLEILRLRARAEAALTPVGRFDLKVRNPDSLAE